MRDFARIGALLAALSGGVSCGLLLGMSGARAIDANVSFNGNILATCVLTVGTAGTLVANANYTVLSSSGGGGSGGTVAALTTSTAYKISAIAPGSFTVAPATGNDSVTFAAAYSGSGATSIPSTPGATQTSLGLGVTNVVVHLSATKSSGNFAAGDYTATVTVRCE